MDFNSSNPQGALVKKCCENFLRERKNSKNTETQDNDKNFLNSQVQYNVIVERENFGSAQISEKSLIKKCKTTELGTNLISGESSLSFTDSNIDVSFSKLIENSFRMIGSKLHVLDFSNNTYTDDSFAALIACFSHSNLSSLKTLNLSNCNLNEGNLRLLFSTLNKVDSIHNLSLNLSNNRFKMENLSLEDENNYKNFTFILSAQENFYFILCKYKKENPSVLDFNFEGLSERETNECFISSISYLENRCNNNTMGVLNLCIYNMKEVETVFLKRFCKILENQFYFNNLFLVRYNNSHLLGIYFIMQSLKQNKFEQLNLVNFEGNKVDKSFHKEFNLFFKKYKKQFPKFERCII